MHKWLVVLENFERTTAYHKAAVAGHSAYTSNLTSVLHIESLESLQTTVVKDRPNLNSAFGVSSNNVI
jgi:hypothetical protein